MQVTFTSHNIRLDDGRVTRPDVVGTVDADLGVIGMKRLINTIFPGQKNHIRVADLGCLEGALSVEFARMGCSVLGVEVRDSNIAACQYVKANTYLPNLNFVKDDVWNIAKYGIFEVVLCAGLLYHFDKPRAFLNLLSSVTTKVVIINTHFSTDVTSTKFNLSGIEENEGLPGRWYSEFADDSSFENRENARWSSWDNRRSFWIKRESLIQAIKDAGFDIVMEQYDGLGPNIAESMTSGYYKAMDRGTFIGIKS